jgi:hypothetical protein
MAFHMQNIHRTINIKHVKKKIICHILKNRLVNNNFIHNKLIYQQYIGIKGINPNTILLSMASSLTTRLATSLTLPSFTQFPSLKFDENNYLLWPSQVVPT